MRAPRHAMAETPGRDEARALPAASSLARADLRAGLDAILAPTRSLRPQSFAVGAIGVRGCGKTRLLKAIQAEALARGAIDLALVLDVKDPEPQFPGSIRVNTAHWQAHPLAPTDAPSVVFRGDPFAGIACSAEEVGAAALRLARVARLRTLTIIDELDQAVTEGGQSWEAPSVREIFTQGRSLQASIAYTTQLPHRVPAAAMDQATALALFRMDARSLRHLDGLLRFPAALERALPTLRTDDYVLWQTGSDWNAHVYSLPPP